MGLLHNPLVLLAGVVVFVVLRHSDKASKEANGCGRVVGVFGLMGSGKSYFAVRTAYKRILAGATVYANFVIDEAAIDRAIAHENSRPMMRAKIALRWAKPYARKGELRYFEGWEQFLEIRDAVVIIDEVDLYAPAYKQLAAMPGFARWKMKMARKFNLDVYYMAQHETQVSTSLRHLTNYMYVCNSWFGSLFFTAKGWPPHEMRRKGKHIDRKMYRLNLRIAALYDTKEMIKAAEHLYDDAGKMAKAMAVADEHNAGRRRVRGDDMPDLCEVAHKSEAARMKCKGVHAVDLAAMAAALVDKTA